MKNIKLYFITFLLFTFATNSMACVLSFQKEVPQEVLNQEIDVLKLTINTAQALRANGIYLIRDLVQRSTHDLLLIPNVRKTYITEIKNALAEKDLALINQEIEDLQLPPRVTYALTIAGIHSIRDLIQRSKQELLDLPNLGKKSLAEIKDALARHGPALGDSKPRNRSRR